VAAAQAAHQFLTFAVATPLQVAIARALREHQDRYLTRFRAEYSERRIFLLEVLREVGFKVAIPSGTYFVLADFSELFDGDDREFARFLIEKHGVAAIPPSVFYRADPAEGRRLIRFAFCKTMDTLRQAAERLHGLAR
jgi:aspartate/methionine/tyrosine aminotransferase